MEKTIKEKPKPQPAVKFRWYSKMLSKREYENNKGLCILFENGTGTSKTYTVAFMAVYPPENCLQVTDTNQLLNIDNFLRARNMRPFVTEDK